MLIIVAMLIVDLTPCFLIPRRRIANLQEKQDSGKNSNLYNNRNVNICSLGKKVKNQKIGIKTDIRTYYHVSGFYQIL